MSILIRDQGLDEFYRLKTGLTEPINNKLFERQDWTQLVQLAQTRESTGRDTLHLTLGIVGVSCPACAWLAEQAIHDHAGVHTLRIAPPFHSVDVSWKSGRVDFVQLAETLQRFGFILKATPLEPKPSSKAYLAYGAVFGVNALLFQLPRLSGVDQEFAYSRLFDLMSLLMAGLAVMSCGHYAARWRSIKQASKS